MRSLAAEFGSRLGTACHLKALRRTRVGSVGVDGAASTSELRERRAPAHAWLSPLEALAHLPRTRIDAAQAARLAAGRRARVAMDDASVVVAALPCGALVAVGEVRGGELAPRKVFRTPGGSGP